MKKGFLITLLLFGCSTPQTTVTWYSEVPGARITEIGTNNYWEGIPYILPYNWDENHLNQNGCLKIKGVVAKWPSGYSVTTPDPIVLCGEPGPFNYKIEYAGTEEQRAIDVPYGQGLIEMRLAFEERDRKIKEERKKRDSISSETGYLIGVAIGAVLGVYGNSISNNNQQTYTPVIPVSTKPKKTQVGSCSSDYDCALNSICVKEPMSNTGQCLVPVNEFGTPQIQPIQKRLDSHNPNYEFKGQCMFDTECGIGFSCDKKLKVCTKTNN